MGMLWVFLKHDRHDKIDQLTQKKLSLSQHHLPSFACVEE